MSKYDNLDARTELEQTITSDLSAALTKRGFQVRHRGTSTSHAPAGQPDIEAWNDRVVFTFETTRSKGAAQDRELNSIRDHLNDVKATNADKRCFCIFIAPETSRRMLDGILDHNNQRENERLPDIRILPLCFETLELYLTRLIENEADLYPVADFLRVFSHHREFVDDLRVKKLLLEEVFPLDAELAEQIEAEERERDNRTLATLIRDLARLEDSMRQNGIAVGHAAIDTLIYLVFLKLYEEKREQEGWTNRLRSVQAFHDYRNNYVSEPDRQAKRAIHALFDAIKVEAQFLESGMFTGGDSFVDTLTDDFIVEYIIPVFEQYRFLGTKIDPLGAVYEVLALRAEKDVKVGQFFTPENIVRFMVELAELDPHDYALDPACGTGRFLIYSMADMIEKAKQSQERDKRALIEHISKHQLFGADIDNRIAKIAKMNMWIHGDGKSNIFGGSDYNGLTLHRHPFNGHDSFDNAFDVVLTNPPLGELNYRVIRFADEPDPGTPDVDLVTVRENLERTPILPHRDVTQAKLDEVHTRLEKHQEGLTQIVYKQAEAEQLPEVQEWLTLEAGATTREQKAHQRELRETNAVSAYLEQLRAARSKERTIVKNEGQEAALEAQVRAGVSELEITGNTMKGGALFLAAIWHYLKDVSYPGAPPEWRGGRVLIILDEGILNTDNYAYTRNFLRERFYIKAVISLTRDTFVPISKTSTKTAILYAVKKTDPHAVQREPILFAHVAHVGMDTKGKSCSNELTTTGERYRAFKEAVLNSYVGFEFRRELFQWQPTNYQDEQQYFFKLGAENQTLDFYVWPESVFDRMHYLWFHPRLATLAEFDQRYSTTILGDICTESIVRGTQPQYADVGVMVIKTVDLKNGYIDYENCLAVPEEFFENYAEVHPEGVLRKNDILIASTGYVSMGKVDIYDRDEPAMVDGHISILRVDPEEYDPYFVAYFLRSHFGQLQFEKWFTGSSGQIEIQPGDLERFILPDNSEEGIPIGQQRVLAAEVTTQIEQARELERLARENRQKAEDAFEQAIA